MALVHYLVDDFKVPGIGCRDGLAYITQIPEDTLWEQNILREEIGKAFRKLRHDIPIGPDKEKNAILWGKLYKKWILPQQKELAQGESGEVYLISEPLYHISWMMPIERRGNILTDEEMAQLTLFSEAEEHIKKKGVPKPWWNQGG